MFRTILCVAALLIPIGTSALAATVYSYEQRWMLDTESGLYWQVLQIPSSTFVSSHGSIATDVQLSELSGNLVIPSLMASQLATSYVPALANLLSFFAANTPAQPQNRQSDLELNLVYQQTYPVGSPEHQFTYIDYTRTDRYGAAWLFHSISTIGSYGPHMPCPTFDTGCPAMLPALIVSHVQPVPLPVAAWLFISGIRILARTTTRLQRQQ